MAGGEDDRRTSHQSISHLWSTCLGQALSYRWSRTRNVEFLAVHCHTADRCPGTRTSGLLFVPLLTRPRALFRVGRGRAGGGVNKSEVCKMQLFN